MADIVNILFQGFLIILIAYLTVSVLYHLALALSYLLIRKKVQPPADARTTFAIVVPAHNEEMLIDRFCRNIVKIDYPVSMREIFIIADNCSDSTATISKSHPVRVLSRFDDLNTGKGHALKWAFEQIGLDNFDAVLVIDADTDVDPSILKELNMLIIGGSQAIQCYETISNRGESWFTQLIYVSRTINSLLYHYAKYKIGLSSYLMGVGMCFRTALLRDVPWTAYSLSEDWEYTARLIELNIKIDFAARAKVFPQESRSLRQATDQRLRWSKGRFNVVKNLGLKLFIQGVRTKNWIMADASLSLLFPNWSLQINLILIALITSLVLPSSTVTSISIIMSLFMLAVQGVILTIGIAIVGDFWQVLKAILVAPLFLVWKFVIDFMSMTGIYRGKSWIRAERHIPDKEGKKTQL
jgi:cellulose synthase/poly-beta-1,6-N-acetylglucosamine synthase-like glycosyltransferase